jgi:hypothetical protein
MIRSLSSQTPIQRHDLLDWPLWLLVLAAVFCLSALISIWTGRYHSTAARIVWTIVAILFPLIGPIAWFLLGWERRG